MLGEQERPLFGVNSFRRTASTMLTGSENRERYPKVLLPKFRMAWRNDLVTVILGTDFDDVRPQAVAR